MAEKFRIHSIDPQILDSERARVLGLLRACIPSDRVHEVGSTAVPGVVGKQDLDFLVLVPAHEFDTTRMELDERFARNPEQLSNDVFQGYKVESNLDIAIQLTIAGGAHDDFLDFLAKLRANPSLRAEYNELKHAFNGRDMDEYRAAKATFIQKALSHGE